MDTAVVSALAALGGSGIGAFASAATTWLTQHEQGQSQWRREELVRRERLFGEFITQASLMYAHALTNNGLDPSSLVTLYAVKAQLSLFAVQTTIDRADEVVRLIIDTHYEPNVDFSTRGALQDGRADFLKEFMIACRGELALYRRT